MWSDKYCVRKLNKPLPERKQLRVGLVPFDAVSLQNSLVVWNNYYIMTTISFGIDDFLGQLTPTGSRRLLTPTWLSCLRLRVQLTETTESPALTNQVALNDGLFCVGGAARWCCGGL